MIMIKICKIRSLKLMITIICIYLFLCSFSADHAGFLDTQYIILLEGNDRGGKDIIFNGNSTVDVTIQNFLQRGRKLPLSV